MKKILVLFIGSTLAFASQANMHNNDNGSQQHYNQVSTSQGGFNNSAAAQGGFNGPNVTETTVAKAKEQSDDTWVVLTGKVTKQIGDELYVFEDSTGSINVDIDNKIWRGQTVTPENTVKIEGEVDKNWDRTEIDVKKITIIK